MMNGQDKPTIDLLDMFAGYALSGYVREGLTYGSRDDECREVSRACYDLAFAMVKTRQDILDTEELIKAEEQCRIQLKKTKRYLVNK